MSSEPRLAQVVAHANHGYRRINDYGIIGNMHSGVLVGIDGSMDWFCAPRFDSPSVFAALLDARRGGRFEVSPENQCKSQQRYERETNVLVTSFVTTAGSAKLVDYMPCFMEGGKLRTFDEIHRQIECTEGEIVFKVGFQPRLNYARGTTIFEETEDGCVSKNGEEVLSLSSTIKLDVNDDGAFARGVKLAEGDAAVLVVECGKPSTQPVSNYQTRAKLSKTLHFWTRWASRVKYEGPYRSQVVRSCLVLKLLQYSPTGAMVAALTTSLPECLGGVRNWDYRYSWIRDAAFSIWALSAVGITGEALDYAKWLTSLHQNSSEKMQIMRNVTGQKVAPESQLDHLEGYQQSKPVRVGNSAYDQLQLDIYGILIDSLFFLHRTLGRTSRQVYETLVKRSADQVLEAWERPDSGIWEMRGKERFFVESRMWCYIALDRASKIAREMGYEQDRARWEPTKKRIKREILSRGWSHERSAFTMEFDGRDLDAANLLMPLAKFLPAKHPMVESTIQRIMEELQFGDLVRRYSCQDGLPGQEGAFTVCSFWLADCLSRLGRLGEAEKLLNQLVTRGNHLGLYSEEIDITTGEFLGNFPQAYAHMGLINAAVRLEEARRKSGLGRHLSTLSRRVDGSKKIRAVLGRVGATESSGVDFMQSQEQVGVS